MGMMNMGRFVEGVGNPVRQDSIDGILKVVVWKGNGKRAGDYDEVEEYVPTLWSTLQFISLSTTQVDPQRPTGFPYRKIEVSFRSTTSFGHLPPPLLQALALLSGFQRIVIRRIVIRRGSDVGIRTGIYARAWSGDSEEVLGDC